jgi:hypothetical protein
MTSNTADLISDEELSNREKSITDYPEYRVFYFESGTSEERWVDSVNGRALVRLAAGNSFHYFRIERRGSHNFSTTYDCVYRQAGPEIDEKAEGTNGVACPNLPDISKSRYIKRFGAALIYMPSERPFSIAYRGWISQHKNPGLNTPDPGAGWWYTGLGAKCGTAEHEHWITAMEFRASPENAP